MKKFVLFVILLVTLIITEFSAMRVQVRIAKKENLEIQEMNAITVMEATLKNKSASASLKTSGNSFYQIPIERQDPTEEVVAVEEVSEENSAIPVIKLVKKEVSISVGEKFTPADYVDSVSDDIDSEDYLRDSIMIDGTYDTSTAGEYKIKYRVMDSDGNVSKAKSLVLTVK